MVKEYFPDSEEEMIALGESLWERFKPGDIVLLEGDLGMGKTTLSKGIIKKAGHLGSVKSPTFTLFNVYNLPIPVLHADLYRIPSGEELGIEEYLEDHVVLIEWPDRMPSLQNLPRTWKIQLEFAGEGRRVIVNEPGSKSY